MKNRQIKYILSILGLLILVACTHPAFHVVANKAQEANVLLARETEYLEAKKKKDYKSIYLLQSPLFRAMITLPDYIANGGRVLMDMSKMDAAHPLPKKYIYSGFPSNTVDYKMEKIYIDKDSRYARVEIVLFEEVLFPIRSAGPITIKLKTVDYWEKVSSSWYLLSKQRISEELHISGKATIAKINKDISFPEEVAEYEEIVLDNIK